MPVLIRVERGNADLRLTSKLLQLGRHYKIHIILAAQNPTVNTMKVDLGTITNRIALRCAKRNHSETILGEGGAEKLLGKGDMYFIAPQFSEPQRLQGVFATPREIALLVRKARQEWKASLLQYGEAFASNRFVITEEELQWSESDDAPVINPGSANRCGDDKLFPQILMWALGRETISVNMIIETFSIGWKRANIRQTRWCFDCYERL